MSLFDDIETEEAKRQNKGCYMPGYKCHDDSMEGEDVQEFLTTISYKPKSKKRKAKKKTIISAMTEQILKDLERDDWVEEGWPVHDTYSKYTNPTLPYGLKINEGNEVELIDYHGDAFTKEEQKLIAKAIIAFDKRMEVKARELDAKRVALLNQSVLKRLFPSIPNPLEPSDKQNINPNPEVDRNLTPGEL